jgi:hypothetical protein
MNSAIQNVVMEVTVQVVNDMNEKDYDWVSVSSLAVQLNVSKQTIYNRCARGEYPTKTFKRGSMVGLLVGTPKL